MRLKVIDQRAIMQIILVSSILSFFIRKLRNTVFHLRDNILIQNTGFFAVILKDCILVQNTVNFLKTEKFYSN